MSFVRGYGKGRRFGPGKWEGLVREWTGEIMGCVGGSC
jgi:hypothetical protein